MSSTQLSGVLEDVQNFVFKTTLGRIALGATVLIVGSKLVENSKTKRRREAWKEKSKTKLILHQVIPGYKIASMSPFCLKLETYLRLAGIEYENDTSDPFGPKGKTPWITVDGEEIGDSELIITDLEQRYKKDVDKNLDKETVAEANAVQFMLEDHAFWGFQHYRFFEANVSDVFPIPFLFKCHIKRIYKKALYFQGMGRHSVEDIHKLVKEDLETASTILGSKPFFGGDEPCRADCAIFGFLAQILYTTDGSDYERAVSVDHPNLHEYILRMQTKFWPDWNDRRSEREH